MYVLRDCWAVSLNNEQSMNSLEHASKFVEYRKVYGTDPRTFYNIRDSSRLSRDHRIRYRPNQTVRDDNHMEHIRIWRHRGVIICSRITDRTRAPSGALCGQRCGVDF